MTRYRADFPCPVAFEEQTVESTLAEVLSENGARQLHVAETEKYAHVTYFFNGGEEQEWEGETRILVPSPRDVPSYDLKPEMSADEVAERFCAEIGCAATGSRSSTSRTRTWSGTRARSRPSSPRSRRWTGVSAASSTAWSVREASV